MRAVVFVFVDLSWRHGLCAKEVATWNRRRPPVFSFDDGGSTSRLLCAKPAAPTQQIDEHEHDDPHVLVESHVVITTDTYPIDSRALGVGWVAGFGFACYGPALRVGRTKTKSRGRARAIATTGALCSPALGEPDAYPAVSGGAGGAENRNAPNDTAALSFVENSEAARYVFVVVVIGDVMILAVVTTLFFWRAQPHQDHHPILNR